MSDTDAWIATCDLLRARVARLEDALDDVYEMIAGYVDVVDGDYGMPAPNSAMSAQMRIDAVMGRRP